MRWGWPAHLLERRATVRKAQSLWSEIPDSEVEEYNEIFKRLTLSSISQLLELYEKWMYDDISHVQDFLIFGLFSGFKVNS